MSKFKIGDKVRVKYIPGVTDYCPDGTFNKYPDLQGEKEIQWISQIGSASAFKLRDDPDGFWFREESLEFVNTSGNTQRTLLGLETEYKALHDRAVETLHKMNLVQTEIQKLREMEE